MFDLRSGKHGKFWIPFPTLNFELILGIGHLPLEISEL